MNFANDLQSKTPGGLSLQWNKIEDAKGAIAQQSLGYTGHGLHFDYATRDVARTFASFKGLEADKALWEKEKGLTTSTLGLGLDLATIKKGEATSQFAFSLAPLY